jgi:hypothetical protein
MQDAVFIDGQRSTEIRLVFLGKLNLPSRTQAINDGRKNAYRLTIPDRISSMNSIPEQIFPSFQKKKKHIRRESTNLTLFGANGSEIKTYGLNITESSDKAFHRNS